MAKYKDFIPQNVAISKAKRIGIYDNKGNRMGIIPLRTLTPPNTKKKLYSFGALSDVHYQYDTAPEDFATAVNYLVSEEQVAFICICGDLTSQGTADELNEYKNAVEELNVDIPIYTMMGNHDARQGLMESIADYTGNPNYYRVEYGDDVFIFVGNVADWVTQVMSNEELQWLYETLEKYRNKRCFLFEHIRPTDGSGNALGAYQRTDIVDWGGTCGQVFESLLTHYHNAIFFHGHSHLKFYLQKDDKKANYDNMRGCHSIHIPSIAVPRDIIGAEATNIYAESEGYLVDVYPDGIHLRGRDFVKGEFLPIASYWLDTTLKVIPENTFVDETGTITT